MNCKSNEKVLLLPGGRPMLCCTWEAQNVKGAAGLMSLGVRQMEIP